MAMDGWKRKVDCHNPSIKQKKQLLRPKQIEIQRERPRTHHHDIENLAPQIVCEPQDGLCIRILGLPKDAFPDGSCELHVIIVEDAERGVVAKHVVERDLLHILELLVDAQFRYLTKENMVRRGTGGADGEKKCQGGLAERCAVAVALSQFL